MKITEIISKFKNLEEVKIYEHKIHKIERLNHYSVMYGLFKGEKIIIWCFEFDDGRIEFDLGGYKLVHDQIARAFYDIGGCSVNYGETINNK